MDDESDKPVGFNIIFPSMLAGCIGMGLEMPLTQAHVDDILLLRDKELQRLESFSRSPPVFPCIFMLRPQKMGKY